MLREWKAQGEYEYWVVYEYHPEEGTGAVYSQIRGLTKRAAVAVAAALNTAFQQGQEHAGEAVLQAAENEAKAPLEEYRWRVPPNTPERKGQSND